MTFLIFLVIVLAVGLVVAWYDGGQEEQRLITQPVDMSEIRS